MLEGFDQVLKLRDLNEQASLFLENPVKMLSSGKNVVFLHGEQEWPGYNDGEGGADLIFSPSASKRRPALNVPMQIVIFHANNQRSFHAGSACVSKTSVNVAHSNNFLFCANPNDRFCNNYHGLVPSFAWSSDSQLQLSSADVRRPEIGGQGKDCGETVTVEVKNWKANPSQGSKKSFLTKLNNILKKDKAYRNDLDFKNILATFKKLGRDQIVRETKAVNILQIPGSGDCFLQACTLSIMPSADPVHGASLYRALFPPPLHFTQICFQR